MNTTSHEASKQDADRSTTSQNMGMNSAESSSTGSLGVGKGMGSADSGSGAVSSGTLQKKATARRSHGAMAK